MRGWRREDWLSLVLSLTVALLVAGLAAANAGEVRSPLEDWGLSGTAYPEMNVTVVLDIVNTLRPVSPPPLWVWAPVDGTATCVVKLDPGGLRLVEVSCPVTVTLGPGEAGTCVCRGYAEGVGVYVVSVDAMCSYMAWRRAIYRVCQGYCETTTATQLPNGTTVTRTLTVCCETVTVTYTHYRRAWVRLGDAATVTVIARSINKTYLPLSIECAWPAPGEPGTCTLRLWNLAAGMVLGNATAAPFNPHMLLLYRPRITVLWGNEVLLNASWEGWAWPAGGLEDAKPVAVAFNLTPTPPHRTYTLTVVIEAVVDEGPRALTYSYNVVYPYGWEVVVDDECSTVTWTPTGEPRVETSVTDTRPPRVAAHGDRVLVVDPGSCGCLGYVAVPGHGGWRLHGRAVTITLSPGTWTVIAADCRGNQAAYTVAVPDATTYTHRPEDYAPALLTLLFVLVALAVARGRWASRGAW